MKQFVYIHTPLLETWESVYSDVVSFIPESLKGTTYSVVVGDGRSDGTINPIHFRNYGCDYDEVAALQTMWNHAKYLKEEAVFYYLHLKGVTRRGEERVHCDEWRRFMCHFLFKDIELNNRLLIKHDCIGSLLLTNPLHYQGNFFACTSSHMKRLPYLEYRSKNRYHQSWVTSVQGKYVSLVDVNGVADLYRSSLNRFSHRVNPKYLEQTKYPHGATVINGYFLCET